MNKSGSLVVVVNEDKHEHTGVAVSGLAPTAGRTLHPALTDDLRTVRDSRILVGLQPYAAKVFTTSSRLPVKNAAGRDFGMAANGLVIETDQK